VKNRADALWRFLALFYWFLALFYWFLALFYWFLALFFLLFFLFSFFFSSSCLVMRAIRWLGGYN